MTGESRFTIHGKTEAIETVDDWYKHAKPKHRKRHWQPKRSAMALANARCIPGGPHLPYELRRLLESAPQTRGFVPIEAFAEKVTKLDTLRGECRNHDLVMFGSANGVSTLVTIEAKADESFGDTIAVRLSNAKVGSQIEKRISTIVGGVLNRKLDHDVSLLRYQLLHAVAGTLIEAQLQGARQAVFIVHVFLSSKCTKNKLERNARDWERFVQMFIPTTSLSGSGLLGPFRVHGGDSIPSGIPLFLGKVITDIDVI